MGTAHATQSPARSMRGRVVSQASQSVVTAVLAGYRLAAGDAIDATRALRAALHGFVILELTGGFGLPVDVAGSFERLVVGLVSAFSAWSVAPNTTSAEA